MAIDRSDRICIVGAGPAGLATAHRLRKEGYTHVTVLEKLQEVGGLCVTYEFEGKAFDLGANYVTSAYRDIRKMAKEVGAELYIERQAKFFNKDRHQFQSILQTAIGSTGFPRFSWSCLKYLWKRRRLNKKLPSSGYGDIDQHPELMCTFADWLRNERLEDLETLFSIPISLMGYGRLDEIPAPYALTYMRVGTVIDLMLYGLLPRPGSGGHRWPRRFVQGFQRFWEKVAEPLDVRTDVHITAVTRRPDGVTVEAEMPHRVNSEIVHRSKTLEFDWLVLCCPLQLDVTEPFLDLSTQERQLFDRITLNPFFITTWVLEAGDKDVLPSPLVNITPIPERASANPTIITKQFADNPLVTFYTPVAQLGEGMYDGVVAGVQALADEVNLNLPAEPETWDNFPYFPQVSVEDFKGGWYTDLEALQGQHRTFYNGGIMAFELIEPIVEYSNDLVDRFFTGPDTLRAGLREPDGRWSSEGDPVTACAIRAGFTDLKEESDFELEVEGEIPDWVAGGLVRNGTARWDYGRGRLNHWFDGMAMLHRFSIEDGAVRYKNRYLRSKNYSAAVRHGRNMYAQFGTDPQRSFWNRVQVSVDFSLQIGNNDFITVTPFGSEWISVGETPTQVAIDIESLDTNGVFRFKDRLLSMWTCSHMLPDVANNRVYNFSILALPFLSRYRLWHADADDHTRHVYATVKDRKPSYMHSFGLSENHVVLTQFPLKLSPVKLLFSGFTGTPISRCMSWDPDIETKTVVIHKATGKVVNEVELPAMFGLHYLNTWEEDGDLVFDIATYENSSPLYHLFFDRLFSSDGGHVPYSCVMRYRVPLDGGPPAEPVRISDAAIEMPRINFERNSKPYRWAYGQGWDEPGHWYNRLVKIDTENPDASANATMWGRNEYFPSEPVFVPRPPSGGGTGEEDDGVVVSVVLDVTDEHQPSSFLVVLDGRTFVEVARARLPHVVPFGLHGEFVGKGWT